jgi:hypothetical protein
MDRASKDSKGIKNESGGDNLVQPDDGSKNVSASLKYPDFPQPSHQRPPFFPATGRKQQDLDNPKFMQCSRKHEMRQNNLLRQAFELNLPARQASLSQLLQKHNKKGVVLVMMINRGFMDMFLNWVYSCEENGIDPRSWTLVFALDSEVRGQLEELGFAVYTDDSSYGKQPKKAVKAFGDKNFARLMFAKTAVVQDVLLLGYDVLFQDADVVWQKDPLDFFTQPSRQGFDAQFMYDGPNQFYEPLHANSGFFFLRNTTETKFFWNMVFENYDKILYYRSQQKVVNIILLSRFFRGLKLDILPEKDFANGHLFCEDKPLKLPRNPFVVHCSWTKNIQHKIEKYKNANLWYL